MSPAPRIRDYGIDPGQHPGLHHPTEDWHLPSSVSDRIEAGKRMRSRLPHHLLGTVSRATRNPLAIIDAQNANRLQHLIPLRTERMAQSPFAFYRGTAAIMAADFAEEEHSNVLIPSCGDAHISNFGFFASPQQTLVFDLNDFDEAAWAPWEWDLKRMVASIVIAGQATARDQVAVEDAVLTAVRAYAIALRTAAKLSPRERYFARFDAEAAFDGLDPESQSVLKRAIKHAKRKTGERAAKKLTQTGDDGRMRFVENPPTMTRLDAETEADLQSIVQSYLATASTDIQLLSRHYTVCDVSRRVVGVGSVGTRCSLALMQDGDGNSMILQSKEAVRSVLEEHGRIVQPEIMSRTVEAVGEGARVVGLQRILQAVSDPFLAYLRYNGLDLYVRQFHDMKGGIEAEELEDQPFTTYAQACAVILARAHSQSLWAPLISGYIGGGRSLGRVLVEWGYAYADRSREDYELFVASNAQLEP